MHSDPSYLNIIGNPVTLEGHLRSLPVLPYYVSVDLTFQGQPQHPEHTQHNTTLDPYLGSNDKTITIETDFRNSESKPYDGFMDDLSRLLHTGYAVVSANLSINRMGVPKGWVTSRFDPYFIFITRNMPGAFKVQLTLQAYETPDHELIRTPESSSEIYKPEQALLSWLESLGPHFRQSD